MTIPPTVQMWLRIILMVALAILLIDNVLTQDWFRVTILALIVVWNGVALLRIWRRPTPEIQPV